jgi:transporter family protein
MEIGLLISCYTLKPIFKKILASKLNYNEQLFTNYFLCSILVFAYFLYLTSNGYESFGKIKSLDNYNKFISILYAVITVLGSLLFFRLLEHYEISYITPIVQPCVIVLTFLISIYVFKESVTYTKMAGTIMIILGVILMNL